MTSRRNLNSSNTTANQERMTIDLEQARVMRSSSSSKRNIAIKKSGTNTTTNNNTQMQNDVEKAFTSLDRAETLVQRKKLEEALSLYEDTIGNLIKIVNELKKTDKDKKDVDLDLVVSRVKVALTDAESLKEELQTKKQTKTSSSGDGGGGAAGVNTTATTKRPTGPQKQQSSFFNWFGGTNPDPIPTPTPSAPASAVQKQAAPSRKTLQQTKTTKEKKYAASSRQLANNRAKLPSAQLLEPSKSEEEPPKQRKKKVQTTNLNYHDKSSTSNYIATIKSEMYIDSSNLTTTWSDISGLTKAKQSLQEAAILPLLRPDLYTGLRSPPRGILLYGPPGTGKTMLVKAVAHESQCLLFSCSSSTLMSKWVGEAEKLVRTLFMMAKDVAPSIIFLDEMDALLGQRGGGGGNGGGGSGSGNEGESSRRFKTEFMIQMEGINTSKSGGVEEDIKKKILVIGCTNCPWDIDDAVMRRFQRRIYVPLPDPESRLALWNGMVTKANKGSSGTRRKNVTLSSTQVLQLVKISEGFSCSDIQSIANEASFGPLRELGGIEAIKDVKSTDVRPVQYKDFTEALANSKRSVSNNLLKRYSKWENDQAAGGGL